MGVPAFYRWLAEKYPKCIVDCLEAEAPPRPDGTSDFSQVDLCAANPNGSEFECLYLDMNGVIHPCARPEAGPPPASVEEIFGNIERYIDRLVAAVRPRRLLYMAVDGPAPRAKMNQQRARRFKAAKDSALREAEEARLRADWKARGLEPPAPRGPGEFAFDSNVITPGTEFMDRLAGALRAYIARRLASHPGWRDLAVILSDASVPGEGEHKIMRHIRYQRTLPGYDPNLTHVVHGLDADLIMLALATHEPRFCILREVVLTPRDKKKKDKEEGRAVLDEDEEAAAAAEAALAKRRGGKPLQFLRVHTLREYLNAELSAIDFVGAPVAFDLERCIDDFVFLCFFVGNDFLPHMPALEIHDGAIDTLIGIYLSSIVDLGGYVTDAGDVDLQRAELLLRRVGAYEEDVFARRRKREAGKRRALDERNQGVASEIADAAAVAAGGGSPFGTLYPPRTPEALKLWRQLEAFADARKYDEQLRLAPPAGVLRACFHLYCHLLGLQAAAGFSASELIVTLPLPEDAQRPGVAPPQPPCNAVAACSGNGAATSGASTAPTNCGGGGRRAQAVAAAAEEVAAADASALASRFQVELKLALDKADEKLQQAPDTIGFGSPGWRERYYSQKLGIRKDEPGRLREVVQAYVEGLCWVCKYYYQGVQSWSWYYPFHYAPCASDMSHLSQLAPAMQFDMGEPWSPLMQLMAVFPSRSGHALPAAYRELMNKDWSPIIDFYPTDFRQDLNGKKFGWQAVPVLPFIDDVRLATALAPLRDTLDDSERRRDSHGLPRVFARTDLALGQHLGEVVRGQAHHHAFVMSPGVAFGAAVMEPSGQVHRGDVAYATLQPKPAPRHRCELLPGVQLPAPTLLEGETPVLSKDARIISRERERAAAGGGMGGRGGGGGSGGGLRRVGLGHPDRFAANQPAGRMVRSALGVHRSASGSASAGGGGGGGFPKSNSYSVLDEHGA